MQSKARDWMLLALALSAGAGLRLAAARGELWVDEIWSVEIARQADSLAALFEARHDNNHLLNSAYLRALGEPARDAAFRAASLVAAIASLLVVARIGWERSRTEALIGSLLFGAAYPFVLYGSEARGYGQVVLLALLAFWALRRHLEEPRAWSALLVSACGVLGPLAHLTYAHFSVGAVLWSLAVWAQSERGRARMALELARCHAAPLATLAALYLGFARGMVIGGGPHYSLPYALGRSAALLLGAPESGGWLVASLVNAAALTGVGLLWIARRRPREALGLGLLALASPALVLAAARPALVYPRYFLVSLTFVLLIWVQLLADLYRAGGARRALACAGVAVWLGCHGGDDLALVERGRSGYRAALDWIFAETGAPELRLGVDRDPVSGAMLRFHGSRRANPRPLRTYFTGDLPEDGVDWLLLLSFDGSSPAERSDRHGNRYRLVRRARAARESGFPVLVYRAAPGLD